MAFVGKEAYRGAFGERPDLGLQERTLEATRLFVLPSTSPANAAVPWAERLHWFRELAALVDRFAPGPNWLTALRCPAKDGGAMSEPRDEPLTGEVLRRRGRQGLRLGVERHRRPARPEPAALVRDLPRRVRGVAAAPPAVPGARDRRLAGVPRGRRRLPRVVAGQPRAGLALPRGDHHGPRGAGPPRGGQRHLRARGRHPVPGHRVPVHRARPRRQRRRLGLAARAGRDPVRDRGVQRGPPQRVDIVWPVTLLVLGVLVLVRAMAPKRP